MVELGSEGGWFRVVNVQVLGDDVRRSILSYIKGKLGFNETCRVLGLSKSTLHRYLMGERRIPDEVIMEALKHITREEFESIVSDWDRLKALGVIREDGVVDYGLALRILSLATRDEYLRNAILRFVVQEFKDDLRRMLGLSLTGIKLSWSLDFENFLLERKKRRKVRDPETLKYYKSLFIRYLEGRELSEELIEYVVNHPNRWVRNIFRHYIQYLYYRRKITPETFGWLMEVVPSRGYKLDIRPYPIDLEDVRETLRTFEEKHNVYYVVYRVMLESGARLDVRLLLELLDDPELARVIIRSCSGW